ncbi:5419_t:CDS:2, partial [Racocetra persica]
MYTLYTSRICKNGPCWVTWQFPIEHVCSILLPLARSRLYPYKNIINNIYMIELFNHLKFYKQINQKISLPVQEAINSNQINFLAEGYEEQFFGPTAQYMLSKAELKKLKNHYITNFNVTSNQLRVYMEIDKYSNNRKHAPVFEMKSFYGNIKYYLKYKLNNEDHMLACINWAIPVIEDSAGLKYFRQFFGYDFIDVKTIDRCVGFIK